MSASLRHVFDQAALVADPSLTRPPHDAPPLELFLESLPELQEPPAVVEEPPVAVAQPAASGGDWVLGLALFGTAMLGLAAIAGGLVLGVVALVATFA